MTRKKWLFVVLLCTLVLAACARAATPEAAPTSTPAAAPTSTPTPEPEGAAALEAATDPIAKQFVTYLDGAKEGGTFIMAYHRDPADLLPVFSLGGMNKYLSTLHYAGLVRIAPDGKTWYPDAAESFEVSDDSKEWTFYLRKDIVTHEGKPFTADDVVFSLEAYVGAGTGANFNLDWVVGYDDFAEGDADHLEGVEKLDDYTVKITLTEGNPDFFLTVPGIMLMPKTDELSALPYDQWKDSKFNIDLLPPGFGPFQMVEYDKSVRVVLERNDDFFRGKPLLEKIIIEIIPDFDALYLALQGLEVEWYDWVKSPTLLDMQEDPALTCLADPYRTSILGTNSGIDLNQDQEYLQDIKVRQAVAYAINPEEVAAAQDGGAFPVEHMMPWNWEWTHSPNVKWSDRYSYDPEKARALLEEAGWDFSRELVFLTNGDPNPTQLLLLQQLEQVGMKSTIVVKDTATWLAEFYAPGPNTNWDIYFIGIYGTTPAVAIGRMDCDSPITLTRWCDPEWDAWIKTAPADPGERAAFYQEADEYMFENLPYVLVPVYANIPGYGFSCWSSKVHMVTNQMGISWAETWWRED